MPLRVLAIMRAAARMRALQSVIDWVRLLVMAIETSPIVGFMKDENLSLIPSTLADLA